MKNIIVSALVLCSLALGQSSSTQGLEIPATHPRLWWTPERLAQARGWYASNAFTPQSSDYVGHAFRYLMTGDATSARTAINYAMSQTLGDTGGTASNGARWYGEQVILIYDWCWDQMTATERSTLVTRWNGYLDILRQKTWGGPAMPQNNYFWGYKRNMIEWGIATWGDNPQAPRFLEEAMIRRWENAFLPHSRRYGRGGVMQEGSQYGRYLAEYATVPLVSATLLGRKMLEETQFFKEALFYLIYATTPGRTTLRGTSRSFYEIFPSNDDHEFLNGGTAERADFGMFMGALADLWRDRPLGQWARNWMATVNPARPAFVRAVDRGGVTASFSTLPLDFFAQGPQWLFGRSTWSPQTTALQLQIGLLDGVGHSHEDVGSWQIWRNGKWLSRESTGYSGNPITGWGGIGTADMNDSIAHNMILVNGKGMAQQQNGSPVIKRLDSQPNFLYTAVDLTPVYRNNQLQFPRADRDNPAVAHVEREFLFIRPLETMVILDRVQSNDAVMSAAMVNKGFLAHFEQTPTPDGANSYLAPNGDQALRITTLVPANVQSRVVSEGGRYGTHRLELTTSGAAQSYFLNVLQARDTNASNLTSQITETTLAFIVTLQHPTRGAVRIEFLKGATSTGGGVSYSTSSVPASVAAFTTRVQSFEVTDLGPVWGGNAPPPPPAPSDTTPPTISGVSASSIGMSSAAINWATNEAADGHLEYGPTAAYGQVITANTALATAHSARLSGLSGGSIYHYRVRSRDAAGNLAVSGDFTYRTVAAAQFTIAASAGAGGTISPAGAVMVAGGGTQGFTITPQAQYRIANVTVNGNSIGAASSYTFSNVTSSQSIAATFAQNTQTPPPATGPVTGATVNMTVHAYAGNGPANLVSNAIPFKPGSLADAQTVRVLDAGVEVPIATQVLARWPQDNSIRSLLVQFSAPFTTTTKNFTVEIGTRRTTTDWPILPVTWDLPQRIFTLPPAYLSESLVVWEQVPHGQTGFPAWEQKQAQYYSRIETPGTSNCVRYDQYYDAITTTYQMYVRTGDLRYLVNARRWALHHRRDQIWLDGANIGHPRCDGSYLNNTRYALPQGLVSDYFMFGDPEDRRVSGVVVDNFYMATANEWWYYKAPNSRGFWTERESAFALIGVMAHYEATGDPRYLTYVRDRVMSLHRMQTDNNRRAWVHNLYDHDPSEGCATNDYGSSPWMSGLLLEAIIKYHKLTGNAMARDSILMAVNDLRARYLATGSYANQSFVYLGCSAYADGTPDLDNLISHAFGYAYKLTGDASYRQLGTTLFNTSVANGYTGTHKQFSQQFRSSGLFVGYITSPMTPPPADTTAPRVAVTAPTMNQSVSATINATATASDSVGVTGVQFLIDGQPYGAEDVAAPYGIAVNTTVLSAGSHTIVARARDAAGNTVNSSVVSFTVSNTAPDTTGPVVGIASPTANQRVSGMITISATATDAVGVAGVQFLIDGQPYGAEDAAAPYALSLNTSGLTNANHTIAARARDAAGNVASSPTVTFIVSNTTGTGDTIAPAVAITAPLVNALANGTIALAANASDNVRVTRVEFFVDDKSVGVDTTVPYNVSWNSKTVATYDETTHTVHAVAIDAAGNSKRSATVSFRVRAR